jgi:hypothetical protein
MSDDEFLPAVLECRLDPNEFDHRAHLRFAWVALSRHELDEAIELVCAGIKAFAAHAGAAGKYHRTLSEAVVRLMACDGARSAATFDEFIDANRHWTTHFRDVIARHYSPECLASPDARNTFSPPDRRPLPLCPNPLLNG